MDTHKQKSPPKQADEREKEGKDNITRRKRKRKNPKNGKWVLHLEEEEEDDDESKRVPENKMKEIANFWEDTPSQESSFGTASFESL